MTLKQLNFFQTVCEERSISKAAQHHFVSQQAMSRSIRDLEAELGAVLLLRSNTGVELTRYGEYVYEACKEITRQVELVPRTIAHMRQEQNETLRLGVAFGVLSSITPEVFLGFQREFPDLELQIQDIQDMDCESQLLDGELDLICSLGPMDTQHIESLRVKTESMYLCVPENSPLHGQEHITMEDLRGQPILLYSAKFHAHHNFLEACVRAGICPQIVFTSNEFNLLEEMCMQGLGLFPQPEHTLRKDMKGLRYLPFPDPAYVWDVYLGTRRNSPRNGSIELLIHYIKAHTKEFCK